MHRSDYMSGKTQRAEIWQKSSWNIPTKLMFWAETFFKDFQNFFCGLCEHFQGKFMCIPSRNISFLQQQNHHHMAQQSDYIWVNVKKVDILKNETPNRVGIFWQNLMFWAKFFLNWRLLEKFLCAWRTCSRCLKDQSNLDLCASEKMVFTGRTNQNILIEMWKETLFYIFLPKIRGGGNYYTPATITHPGVRLR